MFGNKSHQPSCKLPDIPKCIKHWPCGAKTHFPGQHTHPGRNVLHYDAMVMTMTMTMMVMTMTMTMTMMMMMMMLLMLLLMMLLMLLLMLFVFFLLFLLFLLFLFFLLFLLFLLLREYSASTLQPLRGETRKPHCQSCCWPYWFRTWLPLVQQTR